MSTVAGHGAHTSAAPGTSKSLTYAETKKGTAWIQFAAILFAIEGILNAIWGIAALSRSTFFVLNARYVISDLHTWGWIVLGFAALQGLAAMSIMRGGQFGRWTGIAIAALAIVVGMLTMPASPFWSLALIAVYVLVIHALAVYGGKPEFT